MSYQLLVRAARRGDIGTLNTLLDTTPPAELIRYERNLRLFYEASLSGHLPTMERLLQVDALLQQLNPQKLNPNALADLFRENVLIVNRLLQEPRIIAVLPLAEHTVLRRVITNYNAVLLNNSPENKDAINDMSQIIFSVLQSYKKNNIPFPSDISVPGFPVLNDFYEQYHAVIFKKLKNARALGHEFPNNIQVIGYKDLNEFYEQYLRAAQLLDSALLPPLIAIIDQYSNTEFSGAQSGITSSTNPSSPSSTSTTTSSSASSDTPISSTPYSFISSSSKPSISSDKSESPKEANEQKSTSGPRK